MTILYVTGLMAVFDTVIGTAREVQGGSVAPTGI
jgi:hypothetical protein